MQAPLLALLVLGTVRHSEAVPILTDRQKRFVQSLDCITKLRLATLAEAPEYTHSVEYMRRTKDFEAIALELGPDMKNNQSQVREQIVMADANAELDWQGIQRLSADQKARERASLQGNAQLCMTRLAS